MEDGKSEGDGLGFFEMVGSNDGNDEGLVESSIEGSDDGNIEGVAVGFNDTLGDSEGLLDVEGASVGSMEGSWEG